MFSSVLYNNSGSGGSFGLRGLFLTDYVEVFEKLTRKAAVTLFSVANFMRF
jgi:hypothetical protein